MAVLKIKLSGGEKYRDERAYVDVGRYIQNPEKAIHGYIGGIAVNPVHAAEEMQCLTAAYRKQDGGYLRHMILSFAPQEIDDPAVVHTIARQVASYYGERFQIAWGVHEDEPHLHAHFFMNRVSYLNGKKYEGRKADYYSFQEHTKAVLRQYGVYTLYADND